ncbi:MAG: hypothetical protein ACETWQ_05405 [Phycisphaerae bacterium]
MVTNGDLSVLFRDNSESPEILSGIQSLFNRKAASDFDAYVINKVKEEKEYGFKGRLVWKRFISAQDCLREYEKWHSETTISEN